MNRFDIINRIGDKYRVGNTETGEFSYAQALKSVGKDIKDNNLVEIKKGSNFRSAPRIVNLLNDIRPDLPQQSAIDNFDGEVVVVTCDDFSGVRRSDRTFKDDLPAEELGLVLKIAEYCIISTKWR